MAVHRDVSLLGMRWVSQCLWLAFLRSKGDKTNKKGFALSARLLPWGSVRHAVSICVCVGRCVVEGCLVPCRRRRGSQLDKVAGLPSQKRRRRSPRESLPSPFFLSVVTTQTANTRNIAFIYKPQITGARQKRANFPCPPRSVPPPCAPPNGGHGVADQVARQLVQGREAAVAGASSRRRGERGRSGACVCARATLAATDGGDGALLQATDADAAVSKKTNKTSNKQNRSRASLPPATTTTTCRPATTTARSPQGESRPPPPRLLLSIAAAAAHANAPPPPTRARPTQNLTTGPSPSRRSSRTTCPSSCTTPATSVSFVCLPSRRSPPRLPYPATLSSLESARDRCPRRRPTLKSTIAHTHQSTETVRDYRRENKYSQRELRVGKASPPLDVAAMVARLPLTPEDVRHVARAANGLVKDRGV